MRLGVYSPGYKCNSNCIFCTRPNNPHVPNVWRFMEDRTTKQVLCDLEKTRERFDGIILTGGEPAIRKDFFNMLQKCAELDFKCVVIQTNGRMFSDRNFCKKTIDILGEPLNFFFSFHSHRKKTSEMLSGKIGSFHETVRGLKNLLAEDVELRTATVIVRPNFMELENLLKFLYNLGVSESEFVFVHPNGMAWVNREKMVPRIEEVIPSVKKALDFGNKVGMIVTLQKFPLCVLGEYRKFAVELFLPQRMAQGTPKTQVRAEKCKKCDFYNRCSGIWSNYLKIFDFKFRPIKSGDEEKPIKR